MSEWREPTIRMFNMDCMEAMAQMQPKQYDLAIVDPPYGLGERLSEGGGKFKNSPMRVLYRESSQWDIKPNAGYFDLLRVTSKNQIIWGGNYFELGSTRCIICWDKEQYMHTLSQWEMAWTSFDKVAKIVRMRSTDARRFHPTQKPIALYKWLLTNYAKPGDKILDTHGGSGSICIACYDMGFDLDWYELDSDYYKAAVERFERHKSQQKLM